MTDPAIRNNKKANLTSLQKRKIIGDGSECICTCGSNTRLTFQSQICKIERGIANIMSFSLLLFLVWNRFLLYLVMGDGLGNANYNKRYS